MIIPYIGLGVQSGMPGFSPLSLFAAGEQGAWYDPNQFISTWRKNRLTYTEQLNNAAWVKTGVGTASAPVVTPNAGNAPDKTNTACRLQMALNGGTTTGDYSQIELVVSAYKNKKYTYSVYMKSYDNNEYTVFLRDDWGSSGTIFYCTVTPQWKRFSYTVNNIVYDSLRFKIWIRGALNTSDSADILVWGAQAERGSTATSYQKIVTPEISYLDYQAQPVMYQDAAATIPVTAIEQPVGKLVDQSGRGNHATATGTARPTLSAKYNLLTYTENLDNDIWLKTFGGTGAAAVVTGGYIAPDNDTTAFRVQFNCGSGTTSSDYSRLYQVITGQNAAAGIWMKSNTALSYKIELALASAISIKTVTPTWQYFSTSSDNAAGDLSLLLRGSTSDGATSADILVWHPDVRIANDGVNLPKYQRVDSSTDYETSGFPMYLSFGGAQAMSTASSIPFATATSDGKAIRNLLTYSTQLDDAKWDKYNVTTNANALASPIGTVDADKFVPNTVNGEHYIQQQISTITNQTYTQSIYIKPDPGITNFALATVAIGSSTTVSIWYLRNLNGVISTVSYAGLITGVSLTDAGNGWYRAVWTYTLDGTVIGHRMRLLAISTTNNTVTPGDDVSGVCFWGAQLEVGSAVTDFQNVGTDQMTVLVGDRKLSDANTGIVAELSANLNSNNGAFYVLDPVSGLSNAAAYVSKGTNKAEPSAGTVAAPVTRVITGVSGISPSVATLRLNGTQVSTSSVTQGTGTYGTYPLFIGARNLISSFFYGRLYSLLVRGAASSSYQIEAAENLINSKTAAY